MAKKTLVAGVDIGTTKVSAAIAQVEGGRIRLLGSGIARSKGLRKGLVVHLSETIDATQEAIAQAERQAQEEVSSTNVSLGGSYLVGINSKGETDVEGRNGEVTVEDIESAVHSAQEAEIPENHQIIHVLKQRFQLDGQEDIVNPLGMFGKKLGVQVHLVVNATSAIQNIVNAVNKAGLSVDRVVMEQLASSEAVLSSDEKEMGSFVIDLGGGTTSVAVYKQGSIFYSQVLPIGSDLITKDIAIGLKAPINDAEQLKMEAGSVFPEAVPAEEEVEVMDVGSGQRRTWPRNHLCRIVRARCDETLSEISKIARKVGLNSQLISGAVLTGGGAMMDGFLERAESVLQMPVRLGYPVNVVDSDADEFHPAYSTVLGLLIYADRISDPVIQQHAAKKRAQGTSLIERFRAWTLEKIG